MVNDRGRCGGGKGISGKVFEEVKQLAAVFGGNGVQSQKGEVQHRKDPVTVNGEDEEG